jgi:hypothetical protein
MAVIDVTMPAPRPATTYEQYRPWLEAALWQEVCCYCLLREGRPAVDHVEPQTLSPHRTDDPGNLLFACTTCNRGKWDYHPAHAGRRRLPRDTTGQRVLDVRIDDLASLFSLASNGALQARPGPLQDFAVWQATILLPHLDLPTARLRRDEILRAVRMLEAALEAGRDDEVDALALMLGRRCLLLHAFDVEMTDTARFTIAAAWLQERPAPPD